MKIFSFIREFWKQNKVGYLISCITFSIAGLIVYAMTTTIFKMENYLMMLPFFFIGIYILALLFGLLIYYDKWKE